MSFIWNNIENNIKSIDYNQIKTNINTVTGKMPSTVQFNWTNDSNISIKSKVTLNSILELRNATDYIKNENYCKSHNATAFNGNNSTDRTTHRTGHDGTINGTRNLTINSTYKNGHQNTRNNTVRATHYGTYNDSLQWGYNLYRDGAYRWTHRDNIHSANNFFYFHVHVSTYLYGNWGTYYGTYRDSRNDTVYSTEYSTYLSNEFSPYNFTFRAMH